MINKEIDILLKSIDISANSDTFWLRLPASVNEEQLVFDLINYLKSGRFHATLVKEDTRKEFYNYSEISFSDAIDTPIYRQKPGNVWNGIEELKMEPLSTQQLKEMLIDMLTGNKKYFSKSSLGTQFSNNDAEIITNNFISALNQKGKWKAFNLETNFLKSMDDMSDNLQLGYFENMGRDLSIVVKFNDEVCVLLANGYS